MAGTLVIQPLPGIGDMVWHLPHLAAIAAASPDGAISLLAKRRTRADELFEDSAFVRQVIWLDRTQSGQSPGRHDGLLGSARLSADLRSHRFEKVWILHGSARYALAAWLAGIQTRIGFGPAPQRRFLTDRRVLGRAENRLLAPEKATSLLERHGISVERTPRYHPPAAAAHQIAAEHAGRPRPWIGLGIGSSEPFKQWGTENFIALAGRFLADIGGTVFAIGGPAETAATEALVRSVGGSAVPALGLPLGEAAALVQACDVVIGNDTGLLNLAAATGAATIGLFGGSPPLTQYPNLIALEPPRGAVYRVDRMAEIQVETALEVVRQAIGAGVRSSCANR